MFDDDDWPPSHRTSMFSDDSDDSAGSFDVRTLGTTAGLARWIVTGVGLIGALVFMSSISDGPRVVPGPGMGELGQVGGGFADADSFNESIFDEPNRQLPEPLPVFDRLEVGAGPAPDRLALGVVGGEGWMRQLIGVSPAELAARLPAIEAPLQGMVWLADVSPHRMVVTGSVDGAPLLLAAAPLEVVARFPADSGRMVTSSSVVTELVAAGGTIVETSDRATRLSYADGAEVMLGLPGRSIRPPAGTAMEVSVYDLHGAVFVVVSAYDGLSLAVQEQLAGGLARWEQAASAASQDDDGLS